MGESLADRPDDVVGGHSPTVAALIRGPMVNRLSRI
jgi:hypothetical protein